MLELKIPAREMFDEKTSTFYNTKAYTLRLEHSLVSISKWESKWHKAFLGHQEKTFEEILDYIKCMTLNQNVNDEVYTYLTNENVKEIKEYIEDPMTATTFSRNSGSSSRDVVTSELIYYWMIALSIPVEFQKWHINRLLTLIRVCNIKNSPAEKRSAGEIIRSNAEINAARRKQLNSKG